MKALAAWFTPERRQLIQIFFGTLAPLAILFGIGSDDVWKQTLIITGAALQFVASLVSLINLRGVTNIWLVLRGAIYTLAAAVSPALVLLGFYDDKTNETILTAISLALTALSSSLAIFVGKNQQLQTVLNVASPTTAPNQVPIDVDSTHFDGRTGRFDSA